MGTYRFTTQVAAPPEKVFDLWVNLDRIADWVEGVTKVTDVTGPSDQTGTRYTVWFGRMRSPTLILEADRPRFIRSRFGSVLLRGETQATFEPDSDGTRLTQEFRTEGIIPAIAARIFATGSGKGSFRGELATFARIAENEARD
jgi:uncharacterized protein YndB with AHSA1/START domain